MTLLHINLKQHLWNKYIYIHKTLILWTRQQTCGQHNAHHVIGVTGNTILCTMTFTHNIVKFLPLTQFWLGDYFLMSIVNNISQTCYFVLQRIAMLEMDAIFLASDLSWPPRASPEGTWSLLESLELSGARKGQIPTSRVRCQPDGRDPNTRVGRGPNQEHKGKFVNVFVCAVQTQSGP